MRCAIEYGTRRDEKADDDGGDNEEMFLEIYVGFLHVFGGFVTDAK